MCYKMNKQKELAIKFEEKISGSPEFIKDYFVLLNSATTKINNLGTINSFLEWLIDQNIVMESVKEMTTDNLKLVTYIHAAKYLDGLKNGLYGSPILQSSIITKLNIIRGFWSYLVERDYVPKNIINKQVSDKFKAKDKTVLVPTDEDINNLLNSFGNIAEKRASIMYTAILKLFIGSGIRLDELVGLDVSNLHFEDPNNIYIEIIGKGEYEYNELTQVNINQSAYYAILDYLKVRNPENKLQDIEALFVSKRGSRLTDNAIQKAFKRHSNDKIHPHMLRHYVGTKIYENGGFDAKKVQKQLRHKNINTSIKYYVADNTEELKNVLDSF